MGSNKKFQFRLTNFYGLSSRFFDQLIAKYAQIILNTNI